MPAVAAVVAAAVLQFFWFGLLVGRARARYRVPPPATTGNEIFELQRQGARFTPHEFRPGDVVSIREGAFEGYRGFVVKEKNEFRLVVSVGTLQRAVMVELDRDSLAVVAGPRAIRNENRRQGEMHVRR